MILLINITDAADVAPFESVYLRYVDCGSKHFQ